MLTAAAIGGLGGILYEATLIEVGAAIWIAAAVDLRRVRNRSNTALPATNQTQVGDVSPTHNPLSDRADEPPASA